MSRRRAAKNARAAAGGGVAVSIQQTGTMDGAMGPNGEWFGPGRPLPGMGPRQALGRRYDYNFGQNVLQGPRTGLSTSFAALRALADGHDLTRLAIETRKDQMSRLEFTFGVIDSDEDLTPEQIARAAMYRKLLRRPDGKQFWKDWLRSLLEDLLVIDAPSIFVRRTLDETEVVGLYQVDGATIKPVIDEGGREPEPPDCAYQQFIKGVPAFNYTSRMMVYRPRNVRVHTVYGFSPVEQILATINIALRRQLWQHAYFTNGNIPDSLIGVPGTWTPDQIAAFQDWFDGLLSGNNERRRGALFVPGEVAKSYVPTKDAEMFGAAEEWFARVVCFCFGISHQALVKEVNRATAGTAQEDALSDGLAPIMGWVKSVMDGILIDHFQEDELEFRWVDDKELDPKVQDEIWMARVDRGMATKNEWRGAVGEDPRPEPEANMLTATTTHMPTPISLDAQIELQQRRLDSGVFPDPRAVATGKDPEEDSPSGGGEGKDGEEPEGDSSSTARDGEVADKAAVPFGDRVSKVLPHNPESLTPRQLRSFRALSPERPAADRARKSLQSLLEDGLSTVGGRVTAAVATHLEGLSKADLPDENEEAIIRAALGSIGSWDFLFDGTAEALTGLASDTVMAAVAMIGSTRTDDIVDQVSERSVAQAEARAAELLGRRVLPDGTIIDNPDARWAISDSTRTMVRDTIGRVLRENEGSATLVEELRITYAFSPARAEMVSRTEIAAINSRASSETYLAARGAGVSVQKEWILGPDPCEICQSNADQGPIDVDSSFDSGDDEPPAHPNCVCAIVPVVGDDE